MNKYDMSGVSSANDYKQKENHPDFTGKCTINGKEFRMAGWTRQGNNGNFISWKFSEPLPKEGVQEPQAIPNNAKDDLPF
jgi:hypothetical protein